MYGESPLTLQITREKKRIEEWLVGEKRKQAELAEARRNEQELLVEDDNAIEIKWGLHNLRRDEHFKAAKLPASLFEREMKVVVRRVLDLFNQSVVVKRPCETEKEFSADTCTGAICGNDNE